MSEVTPATNNAPANWYADPGNANLLRYWDGSAWTEHRAPRPQPAVQPVVVHQGYRKAYKTSHGFHLVMSLITLGLWLPVWLVVGLYNAAKA